VVRIAVHQVTLGCPASGDLYISPEVVVALWVSLLRRVSSRTAEPERAGCQGMGNG
jgi:hypothetical protein